jgi:phosphate transport system protein
MNEHIVASFDTELQGLRSSIMEMGGIVEKMLSEGMTALVRRDVELAQKVVSMDARVDQLEHEIEERAILTIAKRQPMAVDLREVVSAIRIASDIERIGDMAKNIGKRTLAVSGQFEPQRVVLGIERMSDTVLVGLKNVLDAYMQKDVDAALEVWRRDGETDNHYNSIFRELLTYMMEDPRNITFCTHLLFTAKNVERIGDHTTNIAETVHYLVTGQSITGDRPKNDRTSFESAETSDV